MSVFNFVLGIVTLVQDNSVSEALSFHKRECGVNVEL